MKKQSISIDLGELQATFQASQRAAKASEKRLRAAQDTHNANCEALDGARRALNDASTAILARSSI